MDTPLVREAFGSRRGDPQYRIAADADLNGVINSFDVTQHIRNIHARSAKAPNPQPPVLNPIKDQTVDERVPLHLFGFGQRRRHPDRRITL